MTSAFKKFAFFSFFSAWLVAIASTSAFAKDFREACEMASLPENWTCDEVETQAKLPFRISVEGSRLHIQGRLPEYSEDTLHNVILAPARAAWLEMQIKNGSVRTKEQADRITSTLVGSYNARLAKTPYRIFMNFDGYRRIFNDLGIREITLNSEGGDITTGYFLAALINDFELDTRILPRQLCASACTLAFAAGKARKAAQDALFMYHIGADYGYYNNHGLLSTDPSTWCEHLPLGGGRECKVPLIRASVEFYYTFLREQLVKTANDLMIEFDRDLYLSAFTGRAMGLVTEVTHRKVHFTADDFYKSTQSFMNTYSGNFSADDKTLVTQSFRELNRRRLEDNLDAAAIDRLGALSRREQSIEIFFQLLRLDGKSNEQSHALTVNLFNKIGDTP